MHYKAQTTVITSDDEHELDCYITGVNSNEPKDSIPREYLSPTQILIPAKR
jgi:hypothetical protein